MATGSLDVGDGPGEGDGARDRGGVLAMDGMRDPRGGVDIVGTARRAMLDDDADERPPMPAIDGRALSPGRPKVSVDDATLGDGVGSPSRGVRSGSSSGAVKLEASSYASASSARSSAGTYDDVEETTLSLRDGRGAALATLSSPASDHPSSLTVTSA